MTEVADKLREARALIKPRGAWIQDDFEYVRPSGLHCYCMAGALLAVCGGVNPMQASARSLLLKATGSPSLIHFNDAAQRKKAEVLAAFDKAIELAEASE